MTAQHSAVARLAYWVPATVLALLGLASCSDSADARFVRQEIPVSIQTGKPITIVIGPLSGGYPNEVAIRCSKEAWNSIAEGANSLAVRLVSADHSETRIMSVSPGRKVRAPLESIHYLFLIGGERGTTATVEITFSSAPAGITNAEILTLKTPPDLDF